MKAAGFVAACCIAAISLALPNRRGQQHPDHRHLLRQPKPDCSDWPRRRPADHSRGDFNHEDSIDLFDSLDFVDAFSVGC